jgi:hypothetical protein
MTMLNGLMVETSDRFLEAMQPRLMAQRLAAVEGGLPGQCHVLDAKYEPGIRAVLLYEQGGRLLRGDLLPAEAIDEAEPGRIIEPGILVSPFPFDPDLPGLPQVMDGAALGPVLAHALSGAQPGAPTGEQSGAACCRVRLLRYRPGKRATVLVTFATGGPAYVAKAYHNPAKAAAVAAEAPALHAATPPGGALAFAPTVAFVPDLALVVQRTVQGTPLESLIGPRGAGRGHLGGLHLAGRALAEFHSLRVVTARERPVERELRRFGERAERIATVDPSVGRAAAGLADRLISLHEGLPAARTGPVHGDCKPSQFLLAGDRAYLLDLDHCGISDQAGDVGTFLASLRQQAIRHSLASRASGLAAAYEHFGDTFLTGYRDGGGDTEPPRICWQEAVALERKALRAFARAPRSPMALALIEAAHQRLDTMKEAA